MSDLKSRASYLKGLADGMKLDVSGTEGKVIAGMLDLLGDMADKMEELGKGQDFLTDQIDNMSEALSMLGNEVFGGDDDGIYQITCDNCGEEITFTDDDLDEMEDGSFVCPSCGEVIELEFDGCDCGCEDHHHDE